MLQFLKSKVTPKKMLVSDAEPLALAFEPTHHINSTSIQETLNAELDNLKLEEKPEDKSDSKSAEENEVDNLKLEEKPEDKSDSKSAEDNEVPAGGNLESLREEEPQEAAADGWGLEASSAEVKVDGWGWDQDFSAPGGNQELVKYPDLSNEEKVEASGWDQDFSAPEGNRELVKYPDLSNEEKVEAWGWDQGIGGTEENAKSDTGSGNWRGDKGQRKNAWSPFPSRPDEPDCTFYTRNGTCKFGMNCRFNHPPSKNKNKVVELNKNRSSSEMVGQTQREKAYKEQKRGTFSESNGQVDCKYYSMPGGCKYGSACKYNHKEKIEVPAELNFLGLPKRPGEKECTYYMSTGSCKYSINCRFHHPDPIAVGGQDPSPGYQNGGSSQPYVPPAQMPMTTWPLQRAPNEPVPFLDTSPPYVTGYFVPPQGFHPNPEWNGYQAPVNSLFPAEVNMPHPPSAPAMEANPRRGYVSAPKKVSDGEYPERPGQPECQFFMKTGTCKFQSACRYHHPKSRLPKTPDVSPVGLPLRPDQPVCTHYSRHGICRYGHSCRYNHPMDCNPSVSSASMGEYTQKVFPESGVEPQEVKPEGTNNPVQESEW